MPWVFGPLARRLATGRLLTMKTVYRTFKISADRSIARQLMEAQAELEDVPWEIVAITPALIREGLVLNYLAIFANKGR